jgi:hypothetical protein
MANNMDWHRNTVDFGLLDYITPYLSELANVQSTKKRFGSGNAILWK